MTPTPKDARTTPAHPHGPLAGVTVVELAGIGPGPFCGMMLSDMGARVITVVRPGTRADPHDVLLRGRESIALDLKHPLGRDVVLRLAEHADVLFEGFRPGVAERLGIGPTDCHACNPALVYGRMTGWGQHGPYAHQAGHDINYLAVSGSLHPIGRHGQPPVPPLNLVGDFGGGGMYLAFGIVSALAQARATGEGEVIDAAIVDGAASLAAMIHGQLADGSWIPHRGVNQLDSGCPYYDVYRCSDGEYVAVGALESQFFAELTRVLGLADQSGFSEPERTDPTNWPTIRTTLSDVFATGTRDHWAQQFANTDACVTPVLSLAEAHAHEHNTARNVFTTSPGYTQPNTAPRFARAATNPPSTVPKPGAHTQEILNEIGYQETDIDRLLAKHAVR